MPTGVSYKTRYRIDKAVGIWKPKSQRRQMEESNIIGSDGWNQAFRHTLRSLGTHGGQYSEKYRLASSPIILNPVADRIDLTFGRAPRNVYEILMLKAPAGWKRPARPRGTYRDIAIMMAGQLSGFDYLLGDPRLIGSTGKLDPRLDWLLHEIYTLAKGTAGRNFLVTIAKDAGVWPSPKWWRVTRRLLGDNRYFSRRSSRK